MPKEVRKVTVLGANGVMGAGSGELFAAASIPTVFLARDHEKAREGLDLALGMAKSERLSDFITLGTYGADMVGAVAGADLIFEALAEDLELKKKFFDVVDEHRKPDSIVATVSSGLSIAGMAEGRSASFRRNFLGIHLFNPPNVIVGCEVIPHRETDPAIVAELEALLVRDLRRKVIRTADSPAFCANRIGFKVLNEVALLAAEHGVAFIDALVGPHTGRAMSPLSTVDLVGWDIHQAIVDNVHAKTSDEAHDLFALPDYMKKLIASGHLGDKTPNKGGFYRRVQEDGKTVTFVLDPAGGGYHPAGDALKDLPDFVHRMKSFHRVGRYREALKIFLEATGTEADLLRRVILGYVSYSLNRVGEVVEAPADVDRIMGFGFNWAPPTVLVDFMGVRETITAIGKAGLPVPPVLAKHGRGPMFDEPGLDPGRFFVGQ